MRLNKIVTPVSIVMLLLGTVVLMASGCTTYGRPGAAGDSIYSADYEDVDEFEQGANRPPTAQTLYQYAKMLASSRKEPEADATLRACMSRYPEFLPAYVLMADLQIGRRDIDAARATLESGLAYGPMDPVLRNNIGMCWFLTGDYERALAEFAAVVEIAPDDARYNANLALATAMVGNYDEALALYQTFLPSGNAHFNVGVTAEARDDHERAEAEFAIAESMGVAH